MNFEPSRAFAIKKLDNFIESKLREYSRLRNFDFGPNNRSNVSSLSPYVTHGVISEIEIIKKSLNKHSFIKSEKFIQEVLWRVYWKGWIELRPKVWNDFLSDLKELKKKFKNNQNYFNAINGKTKIECFNHWVNELKNYNYLHNHTRMWFSSIWIFTLELPWQLGAEFFLKYLLDGDSASNTLGWRWVAGIQTKGKHYSAQEWNIKKFSNNRFNKIKLNENSQPKIDERIYSVNKQEFFNNQIDDEKNLLIFDNNLSFETSDFKDQKFKKIFLISNENETRQIKLSDEVLNFKKLLLNDQKKRLQEKSIVCEKINIKEIINIKEKVFALYPSIGENLDYIKSNNLKNIKFLYRKIDQSSWENCTKGFFNFKNHIPKIMQEFI
tara:strand:- start:179 stop:1324 length:1146 start_codon:yes stop_codon:yes gene_type:complete